VWVEDSACGTTKVLRIKFNCSVRSVNWAHSGLLLQQCETVWATRNCSPTYKLKFVTILHLRVFESSIVLLTSQSVAQVQVSLKYKCRIQHLLFMPPNIHLPLPVAFSDMNVYFWSGLELDYDNSTDPHPPVIKVRQPRTTRRTEIGFLIVKVSR
jgi:hypothetical protein